jgi:hypothetical protein
MAPIKGDWIYNNYTGYVDNGNFDHHLGSANVKLTRRNGSY